MIARWRGLSTNKKNFITVAVLVSLLVLLVAIVWLYDTYRTDGGLLYSTELIRSEGVPQLDGDYYSVTGDCWMYFLGLSEDDVEETTGYSVGEINSWRSLERRQIIWRQLNGEKAGDKVVYRSEDDVTGEPFWGYLDLNTDEDMWWPNVPAGEDDVFELAHVVGFENALQGAWSPFTLRVRGPVLIALYQYRGVLDIGDCELEEVR